MPVTYKPLEEPPENVGEPTQKSKSMRPLMHAAALLLQPRDARKQVATMMVSTARNVRNIKGVVAFLRRSKDKSASLRDGFLPVADAGSLARGRKPSMSQIQNHGPQPAPKGSLERRAPDSSPRAIGPTPAPHGCITTAGSSRLPAERGIRPSQSPHPQPAPRGAFGVPRPAPQPRSRSCPAAAPRGTLRNTGTPTPVAVVGKT